MRKCFGLMLLLLALAASGGLAAGAMLDAQKDCVVLREIALYGDSSAAEGLTLELLAHLEEELFWEIDCLWEKEPEVTAKLSFSQTETEQGDTGAASETWSFTLFSLSDDGIAESQGWTDAVRAVEDRASASSMTQWKTLCLNDYFTCYPIGLRLGGSLWVKTGQEGGEYEAYVPADWDAQTKELFREYFKIPMEYDYRIQIGIAKAEDGTVLFRSETLSSEEASAPQTVGMARVLTEESCFFALRMNGLDTSQIAGGYGIYWLPVTVEDGKYLISASELEMVYPFGEEEALLDMVLSADGGNLYLLTEEGGEIFLTVLDAGTAKNKQRLSLGGSMEYSMYLEACDYGSYLVFWQWGRESGEMDLEYRILVVQREEDGSFRHAMTVSETQAKELGVAQTRSRNQLASEESWTDLWLNTTAAWDGERLAVAVFDGNPRMSGRDDRCGFLLSVYDESGLLYCGRYECSLDEPLYDEEKWGDEDWISYSLNGLCHPLSAAPWKLEWSE